MSATAFPPHTPTQQVAASRSSAARDAPLVTSIPRLADINYQSVIYPTPSCSNTPNIVEIAIHTTVTISDYSSFYSTPIDAFEPAYQVLGDGSLVTPVVTDDVRHTIAWVFTLGLLIMFFLNNIVVTLNFIQRVKIKKKKLFYVLLASQCLGLVGIFPELWSHFDDTMDCTTQVVLCPARWEGANLSTYLIAQA